MVIRQSYEETKQWIDVQNIGKLSIHPHSACVLVCRKQEQGQSQLVVHAVNDKSFDSQFAGESCQLAISNAVEIPPGKFGKVSVDWPLIARVNASSQFSDAAFLGFTLEPSKDGIGLSFLQFEVASEFYGDYPFSLDYWHRYGTGFARPFLLVLSHLYERPEVIRRLRADKHVLAWIGLIGSTDWYDWYWGDYVRQRAWADRKEFYIATDLAVSPIARSQDLGKLRSIESPESELYTQYYYQGVVSDGASYYAIPSNVHKKSPWTRLAIVDYGSYEIELVSSVRPVLPASVGYYGDALGRSPIARYKDGVQTRIPPQTIEDYWRWEYEDAVILINRYDFDKAVSTCHVETIEHRQPLGATQLSSRGVYSLIDSSRRLTVNSRHLGYSHFYYGSWVIHEAPSGAWLVLYSYHVNAWGVANSAIASSANNPGLSASEAWDIVIANRESDIYGRGSPQGLVYGGSSSPLATEVGGMPYLDVCNKQGRESILFDSIGLSSDLEDLGNQLVSRFVLHVQPPAKVGKYPGVVKTLLEFRVHNRTDADVSSQGVSVIGRITRFSKEVNVAKSTIS